MRTSTWARPSWFIISLLVDEFFVLELLISIIWAHSILITIISVSLVLMSHHFGILPDSDVLEISWEVLMMVSSFLLDALENSWVIFGTMHRVVWADSIWIAVVSVSSLVGFVMSASSLEVNAIVDGVWIDFIWVTIRCVSLGSLIWASKTISSIDSPLVTIERVSCFNLSPNWSMIELWLLIVVESPSMMLGILASSPEWVAIPIRSIFSEIWIIFGTWLSSYLSSSFISSNLIGTSKSIILINGIWIQVE